MTTQSSEIKKRKIAWGITGAGDKIEETIRAMEEIKKEYEATFEIQVFLSKAADIVLKYYRLDEELRKNFPKVTLEINSNSPFLAAWMQNHKYEFLLIAPATSNTVAKIANGIGDTMLTNAAGMSLKAFVPVYIMPTDYAQGMVTTKLPNGKDMKLRVRKEDADNTRKLERMEDVHVLSGPPKLREAFKTCQATLNQ